jgi:hypothetical protein
MNTIITLSIIIFIIISFNIFVNLLWKKLNKLESIIIDIFKKRNNQITTIYWISKNTLVKQDEIFETFFKLKRQSFWEDSYKTTFNNKIHLYKKIHYEINFIIKICEKHKNIMDNPVYIYIKDSILDKSSNIWTNIKQYTVIEKQYKMLSKISKFTIIWLFIN